MMDTPFEAREKKLLQLNEELNNKCMEIETLSQSNTIISKDLSDNSVKKTKSMEQSKSLNKITNKKTNRTISNKPLEKRYSIRKLFIY